MSKNKRLQRKEKRQPLYDRQKQRRQKIKFKKNSLVSLYYTGSNEPSHALKFELPDNTFMSANLRICDFRNLFADRPPFDVHTAYRRSSENIFCATGKNIWTISTQTRNFFSFSWGLLIMSNDIVMECGRIVILLQLLYGTKRFN